MTTGDIGTIIDTLEFDVVEADKVKICHLAGEIYAIAYKGPDSDGWLCTVKINAAGIMPVTIEDSYEFEAAICDWPAIIRPCPGYVCIAYSDSTLKGQLVTIAISEAGSITKSIHSSLEFDSGLGYPGNILQISEGIFGMVYCGPGGDGWCKTFSINATGYFVGGIIDELEFNIYTGAEPYFCHVAGDYFAVVYRGPGDDGWLNTITIDVNGNIGATIVDELEFDLTRCYYPTICRALGNFFAIAYQGVGDAGWLRIAEIGDTGIITDPLKDSYCFSGLEGWFPYVVELGSGYLAVAWSYAAAQGYLETFLCDDTGSLNSTTLDSLVFNSTKGGYPTLLNIGGDYFVIAYTGPESDGWVCTTTIEMPRVGRTRNLAMMGLD